MLKMLIGQVTKRTGVSRDTIRFYEKIGLLRLSANARRSNSYKEYPELICEKLLVIDALKDFGFTLKEIGRIVAAYENDADCTRNIPFLEEKLRVLDGKISRLKRIRTTLHTTLRYCKRDCKKSCCLEKTLRTLAQPLRKAL